MVIGKFVPERLQGRNQYTVKKPVARTFYLCLEYGCRVGSWLSPARQVRRLYSYKPEALKNRFKWFARIYCGIHKQRTWMEDMKGNIIYDTDRNDGMPEVDLVRKTRTDRLPLLVSRLKTKWGRAELAKRLKEGA